MNNHSKEAFPDYLDNAKVLYSIEECMGVKSIGDNDEGNVLWIEKS